MVCGKKASRVRCAQGRCVAEQASDVHGEETGDLGEQEPIVRPEESDRMSGVRYSTEGYEDSRSLLKPCRLEVQSSWRRPMNCAVPLVAVQVSRGGMPRQKERCAEGSRAI